MRMRGMAARCGSPVPRTAAKAVSAAVLTSSRPSASGPGANDSPAARIPTNAEPQTVTVTSPAASAAASNESRGRVRSL